MVAILDTSSSRHARARNSAVSALAIAIAVVLQSACEDESRRSDALSTTQLSCTDGVECPSGTSCGGLFWKDPPSGCENADGIAAETYQACRIGAAPPRPGALHEAFSVGRLPSTLQRSAAGAELLWEDDDRGRFVACAIFGCQPEFKLEGDATVISNYAACVLADAVMSKDSGKVQLASVIARDLTHDCGRGAGCDNFQVDALAVGCWMYDSHSIIAATELAPLGVDDVSDVPGLGQLFAQTCDDAVNEGRACERAGEQRLGSCYYRECRHRCLTIRDCTATTYRPPTGDAGAASTSADSSEACANRCVAIPGTGFGACVARSGT
jgi:hypothetical protein